MGPTPSVGSRVLALSAGPRDNTALEARDDVRSLTTLALRQPVEVCGGVRIRLFVESDNPSADVVVRLCDLTPNGSRTTSPTASSGSTRPRARSRGRERGSSRRRCPTPRTASAPGTGSGCRCPAALIRGEQATPALATPGHAAYGVPVTHRIGHGTASPSSIPLPLA